MPFKIVQTIERGRTELCIVPNSWEYKGLLRYPKKISDNKLARNEKSKPQIDWRCIACTLKRGSLSSYEQAEYELSNMIENSDTDNIIEECKEANQALPAEQIDYNVLADSLAINQHGLIQINEEEVQEYANVEEVITCSEQNQNMQNTIEGTLLHISNNQQEHNKQIKQLLVNHQNLIDSLNTVTANQKKVSNRVASLSVQIDELHKEIRKSNMQQKVITLNEVQNFEKEAFKIEPIDNVTQLEEFESSLTDKTLHLKLMKQYSILCSASTGNGGTCAYKLLDVLFTREFMCNCSWSGGSRGEVIKIGLKGYKNILNFFFELVHYWDPKFTMDDNESFFKTVLKNSNARKMTMNARTSTKRKRSKKESGDLKKKKMEINDKDNSILIQVANEQNKNSVNLPSVRNDSESVSENNTANLPSFEKTNENVSDENTVNLINNENDIEKDIENNENDIENDNENDIENDNENDIENDNENDIENDNENDIENYDYLL